ncbi:MAG: hypothetical protein EZS28_010001 [Streblomastix strix]|uniref:Uncharacterized protein n=1 Tax=Streblomastix strix TaxID=222440 RepID=A0A5J4WJJ5_9EUKA|nr:MAG: hypothetical protein EZS28_010001 [Streblomastix strix]
MRRAHAIEVYPDILVSDIEVGYCNDSECKCDIVDYGLNLSQTSLYSSISSQSLFYLSFLDLLIRLNTEDTADFPISTARVNCDAVQFHIDQNILRVDDQEEQGFQSRVFQGQSQLQVLLLGSMTIKHLETFPSSAAQRQADQRS